MAKAEDLDTVKEYEGLVRDKVKEFESDLAEKLGSIIDLAKEDDNLKDRWEAAEKYAEKIKSNKKEAFKVAEGEADLVTEMRKTTLKYKNEEGSWPDKFEKLLTKADVEKEAKTLKEANRELVAGRL